MSVTPWLFDEPDQVDLRDLPTLAEPDENLAPIHPVFGPDGLEVVYEALPAGNQPPSEAWLRVLEVGTGGLEGPATVLHAEQLPELVLSRSRPHKGGPILTTFASGRVATGGSGIRWVTVGEGFTYAAW